MSEGTIEIDPSFPSREEAYIIEDEFYVAITHNSFEESIDVPYLVARVEKKNWKLNPWYIFLLIIIECQCML